MKYFCCMYNQRGNGIRFTIESKTESQAIKLAQQELTKRKCQFLFIEDENGKEIFNSKS
jgi:hypothetical protein